MGTLARGGAFPASLPAAAPLRGGLGQVAAAGRHRPHLPRGPVVTWIDALGLALLRRLDPERAHGLSLTWRCGPGWCRCPAPSPRPGWPPTWRGWRCPTRWALRRLMTRTPPPAAAVARGLRLSRGRRGHAPAAARQPQAAALPADRGPRRDQPLRLQQRGRRGDCRPPCRTPPHPVPVGPEPWRQQDQRNRAADFARVLAACGPHVDFATVNVSSPNTEKLRDLQGPAALAALLAGVMEARAALPRADPGVPEDRPRPDRRRSGPDRRGGAGLGPVGHHRHQHHAVARRFEICTARRGRAAFPARPCSKNPPACWPVCRN
jgi:hypothetical protein